MRRRSVRCDDGLDCIERLHKLRRGLLFGNRRERLYKLHGGLLSNFYGIECLYGVSRWIILRNNWSLTHNGKLPCG